MDVTISCHHAECHGLHQGAHQYCLGRDGSNSAQTQGHGQAVPEMLVTVAEKAPIHAWQSLADVGEGDLGQHGCPPQCTVPGDRWAPSVPVPWICRQQPCWWSPKMRNEG